MSTVITDPSMPDSDRRARLYVGDIVALPPTDASRALADYAWASICEAFSPVNPDVAQDELSVEDFVAIVAPLKTRFTHSEEAKRLLRYLLESVGVDAATTYLDLPKLRIATHSNYLTAGVGYAYQPHRDVWYSPPACQNNWWMPITAITADNALAFHPQHWERPVPNSSGGFNPYIWNSTGRAEAAKYVSADTRDHPVPTEAVDLSNDLRVVGPPASLLLFSAAQLHSTVPNAAGRTRFSLDFRTVALADLLSGDGARIVDSQSTGTTLRDFLLATDHTPVPDDVIRRFDDDTSQSGVLVYSPETPVG